MPLVMLTPSAAATNTSRAGPAASGMTTSSTSSYGHAQGASATTTPTASAAADGYMCAVCGYSVLHSHPQFLIECHYCAQWFHRVCVHMSERDASQIVKYACDGCSGKHSGASAFLADYRYPTDVKAEVSFATSSNSPTSHAPHATGSTHGATSTLYKKNTDAFRHVLKTGVYANSGVRVVQPQDFTPVYFRAHPPSCEDPILIDGHSASVAHLREPLPAITANDIAALLARNCAMRALDVASQESFDLSATRWSAQLADAKTSPANATFRVQDTHLFPRVAPPAAVVEVDWHLTLPYTAIAPPSSSSPQSSSASSPQMSSSASARANPDTFGTYFGAGSFQDFAISRGGKSTWLSVTDGAAWVFLIPPTHEHLRSFEHWQRLFEPAAASVFLAERVSACIRCVVSAGSTLFVPAGWIYAIYADADCSFFSGYFSMTASLCHQVRVLEMEANEYMARRIAQTSLGAGWTLVDAAPQVWAAVCFYVRQYLIPDPSVAVGESEKHALVRALPYLRRWSATPKAVKSSTSTAWLPASLAEACGILDRLEQALSNELGVSPIQAPSFDMPLQHQQRYPSPVMSGSAPMRHHLSVSEAEYLFARSSDTSTDPTMPWSPLPNNSNSCGSSCSTQPVAGFHDMHGLWSYGSPVPPSLHPGYYPPDMGSGFASHVAPQFTFSLSDASAFAVAPHALAPPTDTYMDAMRHQLLSPSLVAPTSGLSGQHQHQHQHPSHFDPTVSNSNSSSSSSLFGPAPDVLVRHRASCHRCGNLRKKNVRCPQCPHIFCQKCAEKMLEEHGERIFTDGCPVCKEQCCCGKNRTMLCSRKFHCYKKCPSTKKPSI